MINNLASEKKKISAHTVCDQNVFNGDTLMQLYFLGFLVIFCSNNLKVLFGSPILRFKIFRAIFFFKLLSFFAYSLYMYRLK